jgi:hypothetical protein
MIRMWRESISVSHESSQFTSAARATEPRTSASSIRRKEKTVHVIMRITVSCVQKKKAMSQRVLQGPHVGVTHMCS